MKVNCATHGLGRPGALVCQHISQGLAERRRVGFFWTSSDPGNPCPDACCTDCEQRFQSTGEWVGEALQNLNPQVLCADCYEIAKTFHLGGNPWQ
jgi:hypothetical protein